MPLEPYPEGLDLNKQAVERPGTKKDGQSGEWTCNLWDQARLNRADEPRSLCEVFDQAVAKYPHRAVMLKIVPIPNTSPVQYSSALQATSYKTLQTRRNAIGSALLGLEREGRLKTPSIPGPTPPEITHPGVPHFGSSNRAKAGARRGWGVGTWSANREEWQVVDLACQAYGLVGVSLYETLGPDVAKYITNHCPLSIVFSTANHLTSLLKIVPHCPTLRVIVTFDVLPEAERKVYTEWASHVGIELLSFDELEAWGAEDGIRADPGPVKGIQAEPELDQHRVASISYTSGTTGDPKGVVLTMHNITQAVISNGLGVTDGFTGDEEWRFLAFMPLSHIYERFLEVLVMNGGGTIGYTTGDTLRLLDDAQLIKPEFMAGVPRVWNRINAAIKTQLAAGGLKGALLKKAVDAKLHNWRTTGQVTHRVYDALVFRKIRNLLGGNVRYISSGAAPLTPEVHEILKICFSCEAIQGYGMTETIGTCSRGIPWDVDAVGTCGGIQPCNDAKVVDVPEMGYTSNDKPYPRGELCLKGPNIVPGYLHDPENTAKLLDKDGWLHTGDIGEIDSAGRIRIVDRVKNVVKLSQGEYVALEKLEGMFALDPLFATLLVHGDSTQPSIVAVAVLDPLQASGLVKKVSGKSVPATDLAALETAVVDPRIRKEILKGLTQVAKKNRLNGFEMIKGLHVTVQPFAEHLLTPTLKVKRQVAAKHFRKQIDQAYVESEDPNFAINTKDEKKVKGKL